MNEPPLIPTPNEAAPNVETDERFPTGPWTGFFLQPALPGRHWMELHLNFQGGKIRGEGRDWVGSFLVTGRYETDTGKVWYAKKYVGKHDVSYMGFNEGRGIWGTWEMNDPAWKGGFHIWPEGMNVDGSQRAAEEKVPVVGTSEISWSDDSLEPAGVGVGSYDDFPAEGAEDSTPWT